MDEAGNLFAEPRGLLLFDKFNCFCEPEVAKETAPIFPIVVEVGDCVTDLGVEGVPGFDELFEMFNPQLFGLGVTTIGFNFIVGVRDTFESDFDELER